jgi:exopolysaccharide biosynthesis polyprenyl glycosylphosphotransferase
VVLGHDLIGIAALTWALMHSRPVAGVFGGAALWNVLAALGVLLATSWLLNGRPPIPGTTLPCVVTGCVILLPAAGAAPEIMAVQVPPLLLAGGCAIWIVTLRLGWAVMFAAMLRRGWCLERVMVTAPSLALARPLASLLTQRSGGRLHVTARAVGSAGERGVSLAAIARETRAGALDRMIVLDAGNGAATLHDATALLLSKGTQVTLLAPGNATLQALDACGLPAQAVSPRALTDELAAVKRVVDVAVGLSAAVLAMPLLLSIALAVKFDSPGAILFRQARVGLNGRVFHLWKFRTMYERAGETSATLQTCRNDNRVTPLGRFLRRTSLDELPQLYNVLAGDMSIVGPRPHAVGMTIEGRNLTDLLPYYDERHRMKPGITGWAQVNGCRGELATCKALRRRISLDRHYIENWSLRMDALIMGRTASLLFLDRHAF